MSYIGEWSNNEMNGYVNFWKLQNVFLLLNRAFSVILMEKDMKANGKIIPCMAMELISIVMDENM